MNKFASKLIELAEIAQKLSDGIDELRQAISPEKEHVVVDTVTDVKGRVWHLCSDDVWRHTQKNGKVVEKPYYYYVGSKRGVHKWSRWFPKTGRYFAPHPSESKGGILELVRTNEDKP